MVHFPGKQLQHSSLEHCMLRGHLSLGVRLGHTMGVCAFNQEAPEILCALRCVKWRTSLML